VRRFTLSVAVLAVAICAFAAPFASAAPSKLQRSLDAIVDSRGGPPGISVVISRGDRSRFLSAGVADLRSGRAPTPNDRVRIASVTKGFTALLAIELAEGEGPLSLDGTIEESVPGLLPDARGVKLRELLQHTSGLADYIHAPSFLERFSADLAAYISPLELIGFVRGEPLEFAPGSRYHYSDTDNIAAALMAEAASGLSYEQLLARRIFKPLGMTGSSLPRTIAMPRPSMHGYEIEPGKKPDDVTELLNPASAWASGGIVSTAADLAAFAPSYVTRILRASRGLEGAFRPGSSSPPGPGRNSAGPGLFRYRTGCGTVYGHTGSFPGYRLFLAATANGARSVVFIVNSQIIPRQGSQKVSAAISQAQRRAVCRALG